MPRPGGQQGHVDAPGSSQNITLSAFLRDYLYVPLGGNRAGGLLRYRNILITMVLGGLWHGAGWTFVIWGAAHGVLLLGNHMWRALLSRMVLANAIWRFCPRIMQAGVTFACVALAWVVFRIAGVTSMLETVYHNLFDRVADSDGLAYWTNQILTQQVQIGTAIYAIANGSLGSDQACPADQDQRGQQLHGGYLRGQPGHGQPLDTSFTTAAKNSVDPVHDAATLQASKDAAAAYAAGTNGNQNVSLTTAQDDNVTGSAIFGSLTPFITNGVGPTVQSTDTVTGITPPAPRPRITPSRSPTTSRPRTTRCRPA